MNTLDWLLRGPSLQWLWPIGADGPTPRLGMWVVVGFELTVMGPNWVALLRYGDRWVSSGWVGAGVAFVWGPWLVAARVISIVSIIYLV